MVLMQMLYLCSKRLKNRHNTKANVSYDSDERKSHRC